MAASNRTAQFNQLFKVLKKHYKPLPRNTERPVLDQLLFGACLEDSPYEAAEEAFAAVTDAFFGWNEVRVTTVKELSEVMRMLQTPEAAAHRVRKTLWSVFESAYSYDLEELRKENLGKAVTKLEKVQGVTPFMVNHVVQTALGGHAIPLGEGEMGILHILGLATDKQVEERAVSGLERSVPKTKGHESASLLHQAAVEYIKNPYSTNLHKVLQEVDPTCKDRLPKRTRKKAEEPAEPEKKTTTKSAPKGKKKAKTAKKTTTKKKAAKTKTSTKKTTRGLSKKKPR